VQYSGYPQLGHSVTSTDVFTSHPCLDLPFLAKFFHLPIPLTFCFTHSSPRATAPPLNSNPILRPPTPSFRHTLPPYRPRSYTRLSHSLADLAMLNPQRSRLISKKR